MEVIARRQSGPYRQSERRGLKVARRKLCASQGSGSASFAVALAFALPFSARRCIKSSMMPKIPLRGFHSTTSSSNGPYIRTPCRNLTDAQQG